MGYSRAYPMVGGKKETMYVNFGNTDFTLGDCQKVFERHSLLCKSTFHGPDSFDVADALITAEKRYAALAASHEKLVEALKNCLASAKPFNHEGDSVWDLTLAEVNAALAEAEKLAK